MLDVLERRERVEGGEVQPKDGNMLAGVRWRHGEGGTWHCGGIWGCGIGVGLGWVEMVRPHVRG